MRRPDRCARVLYAACLFMISLSCANLALAQAKPADLDKALVLVRSTTTNLLAAVSTQQAAIAADPNHALRLVIEHVGPHIDIVRSAKRVLGRHWRGATAAQRERFIAEFRVMLMRTYATAIAENPQVLVEYLPVRARRKYEAIVETNIPRSGDGNIAVHYRLHNRDGEWKIFDVTIAGISLLVTYKASFDQIVRREGIDALLDALAAKNKSNSS
jgi:phospholipid transport system substrate-binding protein